MSEFILRCREAWFMLRHGGELSAEIEELLYEHREMRRVLKNIVRDGGKTQQTLEMGLNLSAAESILEQVEERIADMRRRKKP